MGWFSLVISVLACHELSQVLDVRRSSEGLSRNRLDDVLTQVSGRRENLGLNTLHDTHTHTHTHTHNASSLQVH